MSLQSFQSALAYVIRAYEGPTSDFEKVITNYALTEKETFLLKNVMEQQRLKAYSEELFRSRFIIISEALEFLQSFLDFEEMRTLWATDFEPKSTNVFHEDLVLKFTEYLAHDPKGASFVASSPKQFLPSLINYIYCIFLFKHNILPKLSLPSHSLLTGRYFRIIELDYDVREFFAELMELEEVKKTALKEPEKKKITILFVADDEVTEFRSFEIDKELKAFLEQQLTEGTSLKHYPSFYQDLVELGLCKSTNEKRSCCGGH